MECMILWNSEKEIILRKLLQIEHSWTMQCHFTDPVSLVRFLFHLLKICPENTLKISTTARPTGAAREQQILGQNLRGSISWSPTALIWGIWLARHPVFTGFTILASSLFSASLRVEVQSWLCCPLQTPLSAKAGSSFLPVQFPPARFLLSPGALGRLVHMESQVDRPFYPDAFQTAPCLRLTAFPGSENWNLVSKLTLLLLSKEVYLNPSKSMSRLNKEDLSQGSAAPAADADTRYKGDLWHYE